MPKLFHTSYRSSRGATERHVILRVPGFRRLPLRMHRRQMLIRRHDGIEEGGRRYGLMTGMRKKLVHRFRFRYYTNRGKMGSEEIWRRKSRSRSGAGVEERNRLQAAERIYGGLAGGFGVRRDGSWGYGVLFRRWRRDGGRREGFRSLDRRCVNGDSRRRGRRLNFSDSLRLLVWLLALLPLQDTTSGNKK